MGITGATVVKKGGSTTLSKGNVILVKGGGKSQAPEVTKTQTISRIVNPPQPTSNLNNVTESAGGVPLNPNTPSPNGRRNNNIPSPGISVVPSLPDSSGSSPIDSAMINALRNSNIKGVTDKGIIVRNNNPSTNALRNNLITNIIDKRNRQLQGFQSTNNGGFKSMGRTFNSEGKIVSFDVGGSSLSYQSLVSAESKFLNTSFEYSQELKEQSKILGFSGFGIGLNELNKRQSLVNSGFIKEESSIYSLNADPLFGGTYSLSGGSKGSFNIPSGVSGMLRDTRTGRNTPKQKFIKNLKDVDIYLRENYGGANFMRLALLPFETAADYTLKAGDFLASKYESLTGTKSQPLSEINFKFSLGSYKKELSVPVTISRQSAKDFLTFNYLSFGFSPLMNTGTAQQTSIYADEVVETTYKGQKVRVLKSQLKQLEQQKATITTEQATTLFKNLKEEEQVNILKRIFVKGTLEGKSPEKITVLATKFLAESGVSAEKSFTLFSKTAPKLFFRPKIVAQISEGGLDPTLVGQLIRLPKLKLLPQVESLSYSVNIPSYLKTSQNSKVSMKSAMAQNFRSSYYPKQITKQESKSLIISSSLSRTRQDTKTSSKSSSANMFKTPQLSLPRLAQPQMPKNDNAEKVALASIGLLRSRTGKGYPNPNIPERIKEERPPRVPKLFGGYSTKAMGGRYVIFTRRQGKFKPIGTSKSLDEAFKIGSSKALNTLARTFTVKGLKGNSFRIPKGFYRKDSKKYGTLFIQKRKGSLSSAGEKSELRASRRLFK